MMYCEPFSHYGNCVKHGAWDGIKKQRTFSSEIEVLIQKGTTFRVTKFEKINGKCYIDMEVIAQ